MRIRSLHPAASPALARQILLLTLATAALWARSAHAEPALTLASAVRTTLERHPEVRIQNAQVEVSLGAAVEAATPFDTIVGSSLSQTHSETPIARSDNAGNVSSRESDSTALGVSSVTGTRWGMTVSPVVTIERLQQRLSPRPAGLNQDAAHRATVGIELRQSLLRGAGRTRAAGEETAAKQRAEASRADARFVGSSHSLDTVLAYYGVVAARRQVALLEASAAQAQKLVEDTTTLVKADQRPAADLRQVEGNLADRMRQLTQSRASEFEAQRLLGLAMGIAAEEMDGLTHLSTDLPARPADPKQILLADDLPSALAQRKDLTSAEQFATSARTLRDAASGNRLPALDLTVGAGYSGLSEDSGAGAYFGSLANQIPGANVSAALNLELPVLNKQRKGAYLQRDAEQRIAAVALWERRRQIATRVRIARNTLERSLEALESAEHAADLFGQALEDERAKLRAGLATVIDVVFVQDRLLQSQLSRLSAQLAYADALARYRFERGDLPESPQDAHEQKLAPVSGPAL